MSRCARVTFECDGFRALFRALVFGAAFGHKVEAAVPERVPCIGTSEAINALHS